MCFYLDCRCNDCKMEDDFDISTFLEKDSDDSDSDLEETMPNKMTRKHILTEKISAVSNVHIKNKFSYKATSEVIKMMNGMPNATVKLPVDIRAIKSLTHKKFDYNIFVICEICDELIPDKSTCVCGRKMMKNSKKNNFLVHFPLEIQIRLILERHFDAIVEYLNREHIYGKMSDIDDGNLYKKICEENPNVYILSSTLNLDGAQIYNSSRSSLWPVQLYLNFLPPKIRFLSENIILSTIYFGPKKPNITNLLYILATEFDELEKKMITVYEKDKFWNFVPILIQCVCDLPARAEVQCFKGPTGKNGCSYCHHSGVPIKNLSNRTTIRFPKQSSTPLLRTHKETLVISQRVLAEDFSESNEKSSIKGVKGQSVLFLFDHIDIINSVPTDYMHNVLLGSMKTLLEIWLGMKRIPQPPYKDYKIKTVAARKQLEKRILSLKPHVTFSRKPRSIFDIANFKAVEIQNLMFYYLRYALVGILPTLLIKNFEKLSAAIYILCKKEIQTNEIYSASEMLINFANEFEDIYGPGAMSMNVHLLKHYQAIIENCGPLWCYSMFGFENNIGRLKKYVCGTTDVLNQIAHKYVVKETISIEGKNAYEKTPSFYQKSTINVEKEHFNVLQSVDGFLKIWKRAKIKGEIYSSTYARVTKSIDYFVEMNENCIGKIVYFFDCNLIPKLLLRIYEKTYTRFHWTEVQETNTYEIYFPHDIEKKLLYFKVGSIEYISMEPNSYARACL